MYIHKSIDYTINIHDNVTTNIHVFGFILCLIKFLPIMEVVLVLLRIKLPEKGIIILKSGGEIFPLDDFLEYEWNNSIQRCDCN